MKTAMQLIRKNETPVLRCDCGEIFCIDSKDSILTMGLKDASFRKKHEKCVQNNKMTREIIKNKIYETIEKINFYKAELEKLEKEDILFSDDQQWFVEKEEEVKFRQNRKLIKETRLIGKVYWKEHFVDEDSGELIEIERCQKVRENGKFIV